MSCETPAVEGDTLMPRTPSPKYDKTKYCVRCKEAQGNIVIRHAVYCKDCFFPLIIHKFRRGLEPSVNPTPDGPRRTALRPDGNLLVGFSGGLGATVLLDLGAVCYVEICDAFPGMRDKTADIERFVAKYEASTSSIARARCVRRELVEAVHASRDASNLAVDMSSEELRLSTLASSATPLRSLQSYLAALPTATAVPSTVETLVRLLLLHTALRTESSHLVLGTSLTSLAVSLISGVSQGRGHTLKEEMQQEWSEGDHGQPSHDASNETRDGGRKRYVRVVRPLRDVGRKECALWARWRDLVIVGKERWPWSGAKQDIGTLTREFITGLEKDYPSTVSTIVRTCTKVEPKGESAGLCVLCARPVQRGVQEWKSRISIRSRDKSQDEPPPASTSLNPHLCYACHTTMTSRSSRPAPSLGLPASEQSSVRCVPLPVWVDSGMHRPARLSEQQMKEAVQDFLLEDDT
ncbi:uncharacterized protein B0H18DRAFT_995156 [Fomitopsis serialis]|uniref:uncharacterized protein n=1 Tax=Fomitopsis serialis TaxID=139415 RepID=UPI002007D6D2|nr:uncharacterized protein B0H18DRAFT_995156 [Neoantrodia serialis]KAH9930086.1 hypothetical protein B0H18DRAFT_995156 [Neoantrodia serialis]